MDTVGVPFSMDIRVARLIPARSATNSRLNFLRRRARRICSPICARISRVCGMMTVAFFAMHNRLLT